MSLTLPTSMQQIIGDRFLRLGTSYDRTLFFIDIPKANPFRGRTRYAYRLTDGTISGSYNLAPLLGATVLSVSLTDDGILQGKLIFTSNPTGSKVESSILYISPNEGILTEGFLLEEDGDFVLQEDDFLIILDLAGSITDTSIDDTVLEKNTFQSKDSDTKFFVIQEDDF